MKSINLVLKGYKTGKPASVRLSNIVNNRQSVCRYLGGASWFKTNANLADVLTRCDVQIEERVRQIQNLETIKQACRDRMTFLAGQGTRSVLATDEQPTL